MTEASVVESQEDDVDVEAQDMVETAVPDDDGDEEDGFLGLWDPAQRDDDGRQRDFGEQRDTGDIGEQGPLGVQRW